MLKEFLRNMGNLCTDNKITGARIGLSAVLDFEHELANPVSAFAFRSCDKNEPLKRMQHLFLFKHLEGVDKKKAERCETLVNLLALNHYKQKYQTEEYDEQIALMTAEVKAEPIPSIDSQLSLEVTAKGFWGD